MFGQPQTDAQSPLNSTIRRAPQAQPTFAGLRRYNRREMALDIVVQDRDGWEIPLESVDISPTGIFIRSNFLFEVGEEHVLIFELQGKGAVRVCGRVVRVEEPDLDSEYAHNICAYAGMGYEFIETQEETWRELCAMVAGA